MIRNILYSLFLHSILILFVYFSFNFTPYQETEKTSKVAVSFMVRVGNSETTTNQAPVPSEVKTDTVLKKTEKPKTPKPAKPKPKAAPKKVKKPAQPKVSKPKVEEKKPDVNLKKEIPNPEKPKTEEKKPEIKEEEKPKIEEQDDEDEEEDFTELALPDNAEPAQSFDSKKLESLDLLFREKLNIQNQITRCYQKALSENKINNNVVINAHIIIAEDGYINPKSVIIKDLERYDDPKEKDFRSAADTVRKALQFCSPLRNLPEDKYEIWRELDLEFDGQ